MIYLTRMKLDPARRATMKALAAPNLFHGAIERGFSGTRARDLWRVDQRRDGTWLLLLSREEPDLSQAFRQFGAEGAEPVWETRDYAALLARITEGSRWHFRLTANPTVSRSDPDRPGARGTVYAHITPAHQTEWLLSRVDKLGFSLSADEFGVTQSRWLRFRKGAEGGRPVTLLAVTFEGVLTVRDAERFRQTLTDGIGRGKAYGLGLLTVAGVPGNG